MDEGWFVQGECTLLSKVDRGLLALIRLTVSRGESGNCQLFGILPDIKHCSVFKLIIS